MAFDIAYILNQWAAGGMFDYVLPFLLIFAIVFGILVSINIFKGQRAVDAIIAVAVGLLALQDRFVQEFFRAVFPRAGVALAVVLIFIILAGFFVDPSRSWIMYILLGIGTIAALTTLITSSESIGWMSGFWIRENLAGLVAALAIVIIIAIIVGSAREKTTYEGYKLKPFRE